VHSNLQKALQTQIPITDLFEFSHTQLAHHLSRTKSTSRSQWTRKKSANGSERLLPVSAADARRWPMSHSECPLLEELPSLAWRADSLERKASTNFGANQLNGVESISHFNVEDWRFRALASFPNVPPMCEPVLFWLTWICSMLSSSASTRAKPS